jgi:Domain of unknown function (DUF1996)
VHDGARDTPEARAVLAVNRLERRLGRGRLERSEAEGVVRRDGHDWSTPGATRFFMRMKIGRARCVVSSMRLTPYAAALAVLCVFVAETTASPLKLHGNNFYANCRFSHWNMDDPIVYPGQPGRSHAHTFFGNASTDASSTLASLRAAKTTCKPAADKAAYWIPTLYVGTREIRPPKAQFYFNLRGYDQMHAFPAGLKVVAGNAHTTRPQSTNVVYWACASSEMFRSAPLVRPPRSCANVPVKPKKGFFRACPTCPSVPLRSRRTNAPLHLELHVNSPTAGTGSTSTAPTTEATWHTAATTFARRRTRSRCR